MMLPKTLKGRLFVVLTFLNMTTASFFAALGNREQIIISSITAVFCLIVWILELPANNKED